MEVVGVVGDFKNRILGDVTRPMVFTSILRNRARDMWRRRAARPNESLDARPDLSAHLAARAGDPEQETVRRQLARRVWSAIGGMSRSHREILVLRDSHDLTYAEIARMDIPLGTVMSRLHAGRSALHARLEADGGCHV